MRDYYFKATNMVTNLMDVGQNQETRVLYLKWRFLTIDYQERE